MGFIDFLNQFVGSAAAVQQELNAVFAFLVFYINALFAFLYNLLGIVARFLYNIVKQVGVFFKYLWTNFFKNIFTKFFNAILKAHDWLEAHLKPVLDFLRKVRAFYDQFFNHYIKPFINLIQHIRQFLLVLRLLHINIATQLDNYLLKIETKVAGVFLQVRATLNGIIDVVNILSDTTGMLRHPTMVIALRRSLPAIVHSVTGMPISFFFPGKDVNGLTSPAAIDPAISFDFLSEQTLPDDSDLVDLPPLDYFVSSAPKGSETYGSIALFGTTLLRTKNGAGKPATDLLDYGNGVGSLLREFLASNG